MLVPQANYGSLTDILPLDKEDLKLLYSEFKRGRSPSDVIAEYGFQPMLVEHEYKRFVRLNILDVPTLLKQVISKFNLKNYNMVILILQKIEKNGIPSTDEMLQLFDAVERQSCLKGEKPILGKMKAREPVYPYLNLKCVICNRPIYGAMIDPNSEMGRNAIEAIGQPVHTRCNMGGTSSFG